MHFNLTSMCKRKKYTDAISSFAEDLNIRIVYSSLPDFKDCYMSKIRSDNDGCAFRERIITQEEAQIINVDDISVELDVTIEDILSKKVYVINGFAGFDDYDVTLYIGAYFTALICRLKGRRLKDEHVCKIASLLDLSDFTKSLYFSSYTCRLFHAVAVSKDDLWNVLDPEAFPIVGVNTVNRQLSETYRVKNFDIDFNRDLRTVVNEEINEEEYVSHIMTMVYLPVPKDGKYDPETLRSAIHVAEIETTLCFSEKLYR